MSTTLICEEPPRIVAPPQFVPRPVSATRIAELDGLRGVAITAVLIAHLFIQTNWGAWEGAAEWGRIALGFCHGGVDVFFVLSGFLIGRILLAAQSSGVSRFRTILGFYVNRAFRILPLYWLLLLSFIAALSFEIHAHAGLASRLYWTIPLWEYFAFLQSYTMAAKHTIGAQWLAVTWSLGIEEQFYLIAPLMICLCSRRVLVTICALTLVVCPLLRFDLSEHNPFAVFAPYCRIDSICMGILVAVVARSGAALEWAKARCRQLAIAATVAVLSGVALSALASSRTCSIAFPTLYGIATALTICGLVTRPRASVASVLTWPALTFLGNTSYFVYLFHLPFQYVTHLAYRNAFGPYTSPAPILAATLVGLALTLAAGYVSRNSLEQSLNALGHRLSQRLTSRQIHSP